MKKELTEISGTIANVLIAKNAEINKRMETIGTNWRAMRDMYIEIVQSEPTLSENKKLYFRTCMNEAKNLNHLCSIIAAFNTGMKSNA